MSRRSFVHVTPLILLAVSSAGVAGEWRSLFNGRDLTGWEANLQPDSFRVVDGAIRVNAVGKKAAHLFYVGAEGETATFRDFELEAVVRARPNSNSGIFLHTDRTTRNQWGHLARGYEVQLNSTEKEKRKTGSLYAIVDLPESPVDETEWFTVRVRVVGKRITVHLDGERVVDYREPTNPKRPPERKGRLLSPKGGAIALQAHDPRSTWYFRTLRIRELDPND